MPEDRPEYAQEIDEAPGDGTQAASQQLTGDPLTPFPNPETPLPPTVVEYIPAQPRAFHAAPLSVARGRRLKRIYRLQYFSRKHLRRARAQDRRARRHLWTAIWSTTSSLFLLFAVMAGIVGY